MSAGAWEFVQRFARAERGSGIVEFAFVAPVFLLLVFAIVDFGRALYTYDLISNDARLGTRYAMVRGAIGCTTGLADCPLTNANLLQHLSNLSPGIDTSQLSVQITPLQTASCPQTTTVPNATAYPGQNGPGCLVTITVSYPFQFVALSGTSFGTVPMTSTSQVVISQ